ncbi:MAG TPA: glutathione S-transferase family protein [Candidatus Binatia bacterium]|jgi:glutathione S-transferase|nr:glutathione S-transferase family protein [Candidatus Binatia bacterium]
MADRVRIIGSFLSPYVRKVLVALDLKGIAYEIDPIVPFLGDDRFAAVSPVRRIPVLIDDRVTLSDSTVIVEYLNDRYPSPPLLPADVADRARARWLEEFADTRMGEVFIWRLYNQLVIGPFIWGRPTDQAVVDRTLAEDVPQVLDYLESQVPADGFLFGDVSVADIAIACPFRNARFARFHVDGARWPRTKAFVDRVLGLPSFQTLKAIEDRMMRTPPTEHRAVLGEMGVTLTAETWGTTTPRPGVMNI